MKPSVFIGSSGESLPVVEALFRLLQDHADVLPWNSDIFTPGDFGLKSLTDQLSLADIAIFIFSGDDLTTSRGVQQPSPRDNVTFELGLFMGALGRDRTLIVYDREGSPKLPTDLLGVTVLQYNPTGAGSLMGRLTGVASQIKLRLAELGVRQSRLHATPIAYWCAPHGNPENYISARVLEHHGITVKMPSELMARQGGVDSAAKIREICCEAISSVNVVVVDLESYGLDSAWEMGYAEALGTRIIGYGRSAEIIDNPRIVNKRYNYENFMHGWDSHYSSDRLDVIAERCRGKVVYLSCPYRNDAAISTIRDSAVVALAKRVIFSKDLLGLDAANPRSYSWRARQQAVRLIKECDMVLTVLPRYGMDTAWKIGYAMGIDREIVGWVTEDFGESESFATFLDHWMHGWKQKSWITNPQDLASFIRGLN